MMLGFEPRASLILSCAPELCPCNFALNHDYCIPCSLLNQFYRREVNTMSSSVNLLKASDTGGSQCSQPFPSLFMHCFPQQCERKENVCSLGFLQCDVLKVF